MPAWWLAPLATWGLGQLGSALLGSKQKTPEQKPMEPFQPYTPDTTQYMEAMKQYLGGYGQEQRKGIYERAASKGTYHGAGGTMPGEIQLAQTQQQMMAQAMMEQEKMKNMMIQQQYLAYIAEKYGRESAEYEAEWKKYQMNMQGIAGLSQGISDIAGTWLGASAPGGGFNWMDTTTWGKR